MIKNLLKLPIKTVFWIITFLFTCCIHIQNNDATPATSQDYIWHPIATKLNCWYYSVVYKKSCSQVMIFVFFSIEQIIIPCSYCAVIVPPAHPVNVIYILLIPWLLLLRDPSPYRLLTFHVPNPMPLFRCTNISLQVRGVLLDCFATQYVFRVRSS